MPPVEKLKEFGQWLGDQKSKGYLSPDQESFIEAILIALPEETSPLTRFNYGNKTMEPLVDAIITFIKRQIEIFGRPQDPVESTSQGGQCYAFAAPSKPEQIEAWIKCMKAEGRLAPVQEPRLKAILSNVPEHHPLSQGLRRFVEFTPSLFMTLSKDDPEGADRKIEEDSDEDIDLKIKLFHESKTKQTDLTESLIIKDFEGRIQQAEQEKDLERAWVLDRCLASFKGILDLKSGWDRRNLFNSFAGFVDLDILLDKRHPDPIRLKAAQRILAERIRRPVHPGRWNFVKDELDRLAKNSGRSTDLEFQQLAKASLFEAIEALVDANFRSGSSFDSQISTDYGAVWGRLSDSLTELLAGPGWREKESLRPKVRRKKGSPPTKVDITAEPRKQPRSGDPSNIADETRSLEELFVGAKKLADREELREHVIQKLSLMVHKKPDYIEQLIAKREISDIMTLANKLKLERTRLYREIVVPARKALNE